MTYAVDHFGGVVPQALGADSDPNAFGIAQWLTALLAEPRGYAASPTLDMPPDHRNLAADASFQFGRWALDRLESHPACRDGDRIIEGSSQRRAGGAVVITPPQEDRVRRIVGQWIDSSEPCAGSIPGVFRPRAEVLRAEVGRGRNTRKPELDALLDPNKIESHRQSARALSAHRNEESIRRRISKHPPDLEDQSIPIRPQHASPSLSRSCDPPLRHDE